MQVFFDPGFDLQSTARQTVTNAIERAQAEGIRLSEETLELYDLYANGDLTVAGLGAAFIRLHQLSPLPEPDALKEEPH